MRNKNLFLKTILICALILWALYALWPTYQDWTMTDEQRTKLEDEGKLASLRNHAIRMGLDLQGGMYIKLEVDLPTLVDQLARNKDDRFNTILAEIRSEMNVSEVEFMPLLASKFKSQDIPLNRYWGERGDSDDKIISELKENADQAVDRSLEILRNRIDRYGVSEPSIQKVGAKRILLALPGVSDPEQARGLIQSTAQLEFKLLKDPAIFSSTIEKIDKALARAQGGANFIETAADTAEEKREKPADSQDKAISVSELFGEEDVQGESMEEDSSSVTVDEAMFEESPFMALLRNMRGQGHEVGVPVENIKAVDKILAREDIQAVIPPDAEFLWSSEPFKVADKSYRELFLVKKESELSGQYLTDARVTIGNDAKSAGRPEVNFTMNRKGARIFSRVTGANIGKQLAIVLDDRVVSPPRISTRIPDGRGRITGSYTMEEAKVLSIILTAGAMPTNVNFVEERTVGPSLGQDSINKGKWSALIGMALVILFMLVYYKMSGVVANIALILNLILLMAVLAQFRFTLTLPGIAGIVLTIGMAVDANVLVFERIREELRTGKTVRASIDAGYSRAFKTILDANITTLLTALVLYQFGTGPVRGFAVTLSIGIIVSMFTALVVTRVIFDYATSRKTLTKLSI